MEFWEGGTGKLCILILINFEFDEINIQYTFHFQKILTHVLLSVMCMVSENKGKFSYFPEHHWIVSFTIYAFYLSTCFQLGL